MPNAIGINPRNPMYCEGINDISHVPPKLNPTRTPIPIYCPATILTVLCRDCSCKQSKTITNMLSIFVLIKDIIAVTAVSTIFISPK